VESEIIIDDRPDEPNTTKKEKGEKEEKKIKNYYHAKGF
jgi:hypothetical protein